MYMIQTFNNKIIQFLGSALLLLLIACGSGGTTDTDTNNELTFNEKVEGIWESSCKNGWMLTLDLTDSQNALFDEKEWSGDTCEGEPYWSNPLTFDYVIGEEFITSDNKAAREFDITFDIDQEGDVTYTIIWIDENGLLYLGKDEGVTPRSISLNYNTPFYKN